MMSHWRRSYLTTEMVARHFHTDPASAKRWFLETYGREPTRYGAGGWDAASVARLRSVLRRNRGMKSTPQVADMLRIHRATIEKVWAREGFVLPAVARHIGFWRGRAWSEADVARLKRWLCRRYGSVNGSLGTSLKATGRKPRPQVFRALQGRAAVKGIA